jgi:hypothetical protein
MALPEAEPDTTQIGPCDQAVAPSAGGLDGEDAVRVERLVLFVGGQAQRVQVPFRTI